MSTKKKDTANLVMLTKEITKKWKTPPCRKELKVTSKLKKLAVMVAKDEAIPGVITVAVVKGVTYVVDGQFRLEAFIRSGLPVVPVQVRVIQGKSLNDLGNEFYTCGGFPKCIKVTKKGSQVS